MAMAVVSSQNAEKEIASAKYPAMRFYQVPLTSSFTPRNNIDSQLSGGWKVCSPQTVPGLSAAGYFFARDLYQELKVPVGLIQSCWAGSPVAAWTSPASLEKDFQYLIHKHRKYRLAREQQLGFQPGDQEKMQNWRRTKNEFARAKKPLPKRLYKAQGVYRRIPGNLYNGMIAPLIPFAIRGVIWYQGEDDVGRAYLYRTLFRNLIRDWRQNWGQGDFPFHYVQLANWESPSTLCYAELREAQTLALSEPNTGMAVTIDVGDPKNVHPKNKQAVGRRLALSALAKTYGKDLVCSGPAYKSMKIEGNKIRVTFDHAAGGLVAKNGQLTGFSVAGAKPDYYEIKHGNKSVRLRKFQPAKATIDGDDVLVWSDQVSNPIAVRYGWENSPQCNLYNQAGLPASPFRSDDWTGVTDKVK